MLKLVFAPYKCSDVIWLTVSITICIRQSAHFLTLINIKDFNWFLKLQLETAQDFAYLGVRQTQLEYRILFSIIEINFYIYLELINEIFLDKNKFQNISSKY